MRTSGNLEADERSDSEAMSDFVGSKATQLEATPNIAVRLRTQVVAGVGASHLETLMLEDLRTLAEKRCLRPPCLC